jgi:hypothetical protein
LCEHVHFERLKHRPDFSLSSLVVSTMLIRLMRLKRVQVGSSDYGLWRRYSRHQPAVAGHKAHKNTKNPWVEQQDPEGSGKTYYWNPTTNEVTHLGSGKPQYWVEVDDPEGSGQTYWWCLDTDQTTPLGAARPPLFTTPPGAVTAYPSAPTAGAIRPFASDSGVEPYRPPTQQPIPQPSLGKTMVAYATFGAGFTFAIVAVRAIFGF